MGGVLTGQVSAADPVEILLDGRPLPADRTPIEIPSSAQRVTLRFGQPAPTGFQRVRFRLHGVDADWREADGGSSTLTACFYDDRDARFGQRVFEVKGHSPGWHEDPGQAAFTRRQETVTVPGRAQEISVVISSAGSPQSVGVYLVKEVMITRLAPDGNQEVLFDGRSSLPISDRPPSYRSDAYRIDADSPTWIPDGTRPSMARTIGWSGGATQESVLAIIDDDPAGHAEWRLAPGVPGIVPGEALTITWDELYEGSVGDLATVDYGPLAPGRYELRYQQVDVWGRPVGTAIALPILVPTPFWRSPWFWGVLLLAANTLLFAGVHHLLRLKARRQLERTRLLEEERLRIARDLHDDLGARLTHLSLLSAHAGSQASSPGDLERFQEFSQQTRDLVAALTETVWTVNPQNDHLESLVGFLCRMITTQCKASGVRCRIDALALTDRRPVASDVRHHIVLAVKEALTNALKHAGTGELHARITFDAPRLRIAIVDHGRGFDPASTPRGNGLANMEQRMALVAGTVTITSSPVAGTSIHFDIPIP